MEGITSIDQIKENSREKKMIETRSFGPGKPLEIEKPLNTSFNRRREMFKKQNVMVVV